MHPNPSFRKADDARNLEFARARGFGILSAAMGAEVVSAHVPFLMSEDGRRVEAHLARSNPLLKQDGPAVLMVSGADGYVSPDWYGAPEQVPTWNYVAVHLRGHLRPAPREGLRAHLAALSARFEEALPKAPWTMDKMSEEAILRMERMIVPVVMDVEQVEGTWKLGQNKTDAQRLGAAAQVTGGHGMELAELAGLMHAPPA
ncbi:FMN-binding negative transcriptional regulator [Roseobacter sp. HKCCA0434]|uniref:FMN-binding negative transcriptional regulator n=1 Tax=Roseobacter sp. HKCCA0434 TaxID=3079297 RepID=UPI0029059252|nr:FMN-binding negative transcriptional regulator [Roseobacter sp. HKCCA0434]